MSNGAPCGACKFLRRKCVNNCIFAPHFTSEQGAARFAAVHKIFGASNVTKLLHHIPMSKRSDAVVTICYEAQARLSDPVYGCVATIVTLQHQLHFFFLLTTRAQLNPISSLLHSTKTRSSSLENAGASVQQCIAHLFCA
uniref:LBDA n=1 Tax=Selaginella kraussiana TaxID=81964 RepID=A0A2Z5CVL9_9TRAC|nr:LBDA [Selaginella kraussiana]